MSGFPWAGLGFGMSVFSALSGYQSQRQQYANAKAQMEYNRKMQEYRNKMTMLSAAQQQNTITQNVTSAIQASAVVATDIQKKVQEAVGATEVAAAATGTTGRSVDMAKTNVERAGAAQEYARQQQLNNVFASAETQRQNVSMQAVMQQDLNWYQNPAQPSEFSALAGIAGAALKYYGATETPGNSSPPSGKTTKEEGGNWWDFFGNLF